MTILDIFTKECLAIEVDTSINGNRVTRVLDWLILPRGCPEVITADNGPEFAGITLQTARFIKWPDTGRIQEGLGRTKTTKRTRNSTYELHSIRGKVR